MKIVHVRLDDWNNMGDATQYFKELERGEHDGEVNYCMVWYDMAIIYCITTTSDYIKEHPYLEDHTCEGAYFEKRDIFKPYYPEYNPDNFGCEWAGEYCGWAPYKDVNKRAWENSIEKGWIDENGNVKPNKE